MTSLGIYGVVISRGIGDCSGLDFLTSKEGWCYPGIHKIDDTVYKGLASSTAFWNLDVSRAFEIFEDKIEWDISELPKNCGAGDATETLEIPNEFKFFFDSCIAFGIAADFEFWECIDRAKSLLFCSAFSKISLSSRGFWLKLKSSWFSFSDCLSNGLSSGPCWYKLNS